MAAPDGPQQRHDGEPQTQDSARRGDVDPPQNAHDQEAERRQQRPQVAAHRQRQAPVDQASEQAAEVGHHGRSDEAGGRWTHREQIPPRLHRQRDEPQQRVRCGQDAEDGRLPQRERAAQQQVGADQRRDGRRERPAAPARHERDRETDRARLRRRRGSRRRRRTRDRTPARRAAAAGPPPRTRATSGPVRAVRPRHGGRGSATARSSQAPHAARQVGQGRHVEHDQVGGPAP